MSLPNLPGHRRGPTLPTPQISCAVAEAPPDGKRCGRPCRIGARNVRIDDQPDGETHRSHPNEGVYPLRRPVTAHGAGTSTPTRRQRPICPGDSRLDRAGSHQVEHGTCPAGHTTRIGGSPRRQNGTCGRARAWAEHLGSGRPTNGPRGSPATGQKRRGIQWLTTRQPSTCLINLGLDQGRWGQPRLEPQNPCKEPRAINRPKTPTPAPTSPTWRPTTGTR